MTRLSLKEQYDNKDVIQQVYILKEKTETATEVSANADNKADAALNGITGATETADKALAIAGPAKETADNALAIGTQAKATADKAVAKAEIVTDATSGTLVLTDALGNITRVAVNIASGSQAGFMNAQTFAGLTNLGVRVSALEGKATTAYVVFASSSPSDAEITSAFQTSQGRPPVAGDYAADIGKALTYGFNGTKWVKVSQDITIPQFSLGNFGAIKGAPTEKDGAVIAEQDGTGSVQGWDVVKADVANNTEGVATLGGRITSVEDSLPSYQPKVSGTAVAIASTGWVGNSVTVAVSGLTPTSVVWVAPDPNFQDEYGKAGIKATAQGEGTLTLTCKKVPTSEITVNVVVG